MSNAHKFTKKDGYIKVTAKKLFDYPIRRRAQKIPMRDLSRGI